MGAPDGRRRAALRREITFGWHNHFATSAKKVKYPALMLAQNATQRAHGRGDFHTLAYEMLTDAAMPQWLGGQKNTSKAPNENLAREFMELFTLGHANTYTEADVREGARALTGWRIQQDGSTAVQARLHDSGRKIVLGVSGALDAATFCDAVLAVPTGPAYLAKRMWDHLVSDTPPSAGVIDRLVIAYRAERELGTMLSAMLTAPEFAAAQGSIVISPVEWLVGAVRTLRVPVKTDADAMKLIQVLRGLVPFYPPSVGGWPSGRAGVAMDRGGGAAAAGRAGTDQGRRLVCVGRTGAVTCGRGGAPARNCVVVDS